LRVALRGKRVVVLGDSIDTGWFQALVCYLGASNRWQGWNSKAHLARQRQAMADLKQYNNGSMKSTRTFRFAEVNLEGGMPQSKPPNDCMTLQPWLQRSCHRPSESSIKYYNTNYLKPDSEIVKVIELETALRASAIILGGWEHDHSFDVTHKRVARLLRACATLNAPCAVREPFPQHFSTLTGSGTYEDSTIENRTGHPCAAVTDTVRSRFRLDAVLAAATAANYSTSLVKIFDALLERPNFHGQCTKGLREKRLCAQADCTHYSMESEIWEPVHLSLLQFLREMSGGQTDRKPHTRLKR
jgi:hypothetical protein